MPAARTPRAAGITHARTLSRKYNLRLYQEKPSLVASPGLSLEQGYTQASTLFTVQHLLPLMGEGASIILNGTTSTTKGIPGAWVYSASKAALRSLARTWAAELKDRGIRVNVISPGSIETARGSRCVLPPAWRRDDWTVRERTTLLGEPSGI